MQEEAAARMNTKNGGLEKHMSTYTEEIDGNNARIIGREKRWTQRKYLEGIETLRQKIIRNNKELLRREITRDWNNGSLCYIRFRPRNFGKFSYKLLKKYFVQ